MTTEPRAAPNEDDDKLPNDQYYIYATSGRIDDRTHVLKHGDTFAVFDRFGEIDVFDRSQFGVFHQDTRFLSRFTIRMNGTRLLLLSSAIKEDNALLTVDLTNPDVEHDQAVSIPRGKVHLFRSLTLWGATCYERLRIHNYSRSAAAFRLTFKFEADFADIFEVRGLEREKRGDRLTPRISDGEVALAYEGLDERVRYTTIRFLPNPTRLSEREACYDIELLPQSAATIRWSIACEQRPKRPAEGVVGASDAASAMPITYESAAERAIATLRKARSADTQLQTSNEQFNTWCARSLADLNMLRTATVEGPYPYAGVPWFSTPFGRDGIVTALACLTFWPNVARGVLSYLAATQARDDNPQQDAQPGKILHETRGGEMAALGEVPFARYYGSVDSTPLFVMLAAAHHERTGDRDFARALWPNVERALAWIDDFGDADRDGYVEYARRSERGLVQQGWKDSQDSVFHADGALAEGPIALCEVQGYVYAAKCGAARIAEALALGDRARELKKQADVLRERFEADFWCEDLGVYALALDGRKRACRVRTSNAGHCLFSGIATPDRARRAADVLMGEAFFSGWGIRTVASVEAAYNPMSYHNGSVWPHDNAIVAAGFGRYGLRSHACTVLGALLDASGSFELNRLPELFCGFTRRPGEKPTLYPTACSPQAWAAATPWPCLEACLGIEILGREGKVVFVNPQLPSFLDTIRITGLEVGGGRVDLLVTRHEEDVGVTVLRRAGEIEIVVLKH